MAFFFVGSWDLNTQLPMHQGTGHKSWVLCVAYSPDGVMLASGGMDSDVRARPPPPLLEGNRQVISSPTRNP